MFPPIIIGTLALYFLLWRPLYSYYRRTTIARRLKCQAPINKVNKLPFGIDHLRRIQESAKKDMLPQEFFAIFQEQSRPSFQHWFLGRRELFTADPKNVQALLATQFSDFEIPHSRRTSFWPMLGEGIFTSNGQVWSHSRAMLRPQFTRQQVADLELEEKHVQHLLKHIKTNQLTGWAESIDLGPLFFRLTVDSATEFLFGQSVESQLRALPGGTSDTDKNAIHYRKFAEHFDIGNERVAMRMRLGSMYWLYNPVEFKEDCKAVHQFADYYVQQALKRMDTAEKFEAAGERPRYVFLHELLKETRDPIELRCQLLHVLVAGRDTTAGLLGWTFFLLARHPEVYQKLRNILIETFGPYDSPRELTFERLKACTYLQQVLQETLRLYPSVPINSRAATKDTSIPTGGGPDGTAPMFVAKGEQVTYSVLVMHRRKDLWGPDADQFNPDRWSIRKAGWEYLPFNGGPRICLGQQFALTEAGYVTTRLVQFCEDLRAVDPGELDRHQFTLTSAPKSVSVNLKTSNVA